MFSELEIYFDFVFPVSSTKLKLNSKKNQIISTGTYPPCFKIFYTDENSEFLERRLDAEIIDFLVFDNSRKLVFLRNDKVIEFFDKHSSFYKLKIPDYGKNLDSLSENIFYSTKNNIYRFDMNKNETIQLQDIDSEINHFCISKVHGLLAAATKNGIYFIDTRTNKFVKKSFHNEEIFTTCFDNNLGISFSTSKTFNFSDIRSDSVKYKIEIPQINQIHLNKDLWYTSNKKGISIISDNKIIDSLILEDIKSFDIKDGILFIALENGKVKTFHSGVDILPPWCSYAEKFLN